MVSKKDKYDWLVGCEPPEIEEHSIIKHKITAEYLRRYIQTLLSGYTWQKLSLTIVDGFAGGGKYQDPFNKEIVDGSPFILLKVVQEMRVRLSVQYEKNKEIDAQYHFIEKDRDYLEYLKDQLLESEFSDELSTKIFLHQGEFHRLVDGLISRIRHRSRAQRCIFVLDQFAYKDVPFPAVNRIMTSLKNSEVILTFGFESLKSFLSDTPNSRIAMQRIGLEPYIDWQRLELLKKNGLWHHLIQEQLSIAIKHASGAQHMTLFFVTPKKGWSYWLVHLSKQYRARAVMLDVHWESANNGVGNFEHRLGDGIFGLGFKASKIPGQATLDFGDVMSFDEVGKSRCISALTRDLADFIHQQQPINFRKMIELLSDLTAANEESIRQAIQNGIDHKEIIVTNSETGRERKAAKQIKPNDILSAPQRALFSFKSLPS